MKKRILLALFTITMTTIYAYEQSPEIQLKIQRLEKAGAKAYAILAKAKTIGKNSALAQLNALKEKVKNISEELSSENIAEVKQSAMRKIFVAERKLNAMPDTSEEAAPKD